MDSNEHNPHLAWEGPKVGYAQLQRAVQPQPVLHFEYLSENEVYNFFLKLGGALALLYTLMWTSLQLSLKITIWQS